MSDIPAGVSFATAIGYGAVATLDHSLVLGGTGTQAVNVGIGTSSPRSQLEIDGPSGSSFQAPSPTLTMTGTDGGVMSIDFNPSGVSSSGTYNPQLRMGVLADTVHSATLAFYANVPGAGLNNGLQQVFAVDSSGNARFTGSLAKAGGSFKIDDPIDPGGKYLSHSFVESPDMMNIYNGIVTLDAHGAAVIEMPEWFEALNRDFRYQLTAIGAPGPKLYVAAEISGNHFKIAGAEKRPARFVASYRDSPGCVGQRPSHPHRRSETRERAGTLFASGIVRRRAGPGGGRGASSRGHRCESRDGGAGRGVDSQ